MPVIEIKNGGIYLAKDSYGRDVKYRAHEYEPENNWEKKHNFKFIIESLNPNKNCDGLMVDKFGGYRHENENDPSFETYAIVEELRVGKFEIGDTWLNEFGVEIKIVYIGKQEMIGEVDSGSLLHYHLNGNAIYPTKANLVYRKPSTKKLKVKGYIPLYKTSKGDIGTWFTQMTGSKKIAEELLGAGDRDLSASSFGSVEGRYDAWKVIEHEFEIEVNLDD